MATKHIPLRKSRRFATTVDMGLFQRESDAGWTTEDGYAVARTYDMYGNAEYWVRNQRGNWSLQDDFAGAREAIDWLRERGR